MWAFFANPSFVFYQRTGLCFLRLFPPVREGISDEAADEDLRGVKERAPFLFLGFGPDQSDRAHGAEKVRPEIRDFLEPAFVQEFLKTPEDVSLLFFIRALYEKGSSPGVSGLVLLRIRRENPYVPTLLSGKNPLFLSFLLGPLVVDDVHLLSRDDLHVVLLGPLDAAF